MRAEPAQRMAVRGDAHDGASLSAIDDLLAAYARQEEAQAAHARAVLLERHRFVHTSACTIEEVVKPALGNVVGATEPSRWGWAARGTRGGWPPWPASHPVDVTRGCGR